MRSTIIVSALALAFAFAGTAFAQGNSAAYAKRPATQAQSNASVGKTSTGKTSVGKAPAQKRPPTLRFAKRRH